MAESQEKGSLEREASTIEQTEQDHLPGERAGGQTSGAACAAEASLATEAESRWRAGVRAQPGVLTLQLGCPRCSPDRCMLLPTGFSTIFRLPQQIPIAAGHVLTQVRSSGGSWTRGWAHALHLQLPQEKQELGQRWGCRTQGQENTMAAQTH